MIVREVIYISLKALDALIGWYVRTRRFLGEYWRNSICLSMGNLDAGHPPPLRLMQVAAQRCEWDYI